MIDDARIRQQILKNIPGLEPWQIEMEEIDFGNSIGCFVKFNGTQTRIKTISYSREGRNTPKTEGRIAFELSQQIKAVMASTPDTPMTVNVHGKIIKADNGSSSPPVA